MSGNTFGEIFRFTTFGESHGIAIGVVVDGVPAQLPLKAADIQKDLDRRRPGQSSITTQRKEADQVEILSGVFEGVTTGSPVALLIRNTDTRPKDYSNIKDVFRPGHADYTYFAKYGVRDYRGGGRSSGRETACRVAAGAIAKKILLEKGIRITAYTLAVAGIYAKQINFDHIEQNMVRSPDNDQAKLMIEAIESARKERDSVGGIIEAVVKGCPPGLGEPVFDKLEARLGYALLSIGTIKGVEFGSGFASQHQKGSESNDLMVVKNNKIRTKTNHAGGIAGGISNGEDLVMRVVTKPPSSIAQKQVTVNTRLKTETIEVKGRHDPCLCPRVVPVVEAMIASVLVDFLFLQRRHSSSTL
ncbi:chorismate synthase [PVC group bacterium]|nr:chorismate synthase [PVC group bacterium]